MVILIIIAGLLYILAGLLGASNAIATTKRFETEEEKRDSEIISEKNRKTIGVLLLIGLFLGIPGSLALDLSWKVGIAILIGSFIAGVIIRMVMQKNQP